MYIPTLTKELLDDPLAKNPTGILLVGDPCIDDKIKQEGDFMDVVGTHHVYEFGFMTPNTYCILKSDESTAIIKQMFTDLVDNDYNYDDNNIDDNNVNNQKDDNEEMTTTTSTIRRMTIMIVNSSRRMKKICVKK